VLEERSEGFASTGEMTEQSRKWEEEEESFMDNCRIGILVPDRVLS
jgi:hypothetical protein